LGVQLPREEDVIREEPDLLQLKTPEAVVEAPPPLAEEELYVLPFFLLFLLVHFQSQCI
jgi:hypothetical protein